MQIVVLIVGRRIKLNLSEHNLCSANTQHCLKVLITVCISAYSIILGAMLKINTFIEEQFVTLLIFPPIFLQCTPHNLRPKSSHQEAPDVLLVPGSSPTAKNLP